MIAFKEDINEQKAQIANAIASSIDNFPTLLSGWSKAKSCDEGGLNYKQYGKMLLLFGNPGTLAMRAMDVEEATIRTINGYENFYMDHAVCEMQVQLTYEYRPIFFSFVTLLRNTKENERIIDHATYSYFRGKEGV